jgi:hypothetical protein
MLKLDWTKVRAIFGGKLSQEQVDGLNIILDTVNSSEFNVKDKRIVAYILATSFWETGRT